MANDDTFMKFQWQDRSGPAWNVEFDNLPVGFSGFAASKYERGTGIIYVQTHDIYAHKQSMAFLHDVRVDSHIENRGLGSMRVREAIEECKRRGHKGICGYLSDVDIDHFPKLKYFYEKLWFSVVIYSEDQPKHQSSWAGKVEMIFENVRAES